MRSDIDSRREHTTEREQPVALSERFATNRKYALAALAGFILLGTVLRIIGANWGLPGGLHPDEWAVVDPAVDMAERNSFEPNLYLRPNHLEIQTSFIAFQAYAHLIAGAPVEVLFAQSRDPFLILARLTIALFGVAMIPLAYLILTPLSRIAGLFGAALIAVNPFYVLHSHYATPDVPLTALTMLGILFLSRYIVRRGDPRLLVLASVAAGLAITSKYPGAMFTATIAVSVLVVAWQSKSVRLFVTHGFLALGVVVGSIFLASPSLFTNVGAVIAAFERESRSTHPGADGLGALGNAAFYVEVFAQDVGLVVMLLAIVGAVYAIRTRRWFLVPLLSGVFFWVALSSLSLHWGRWGAPMFVTPLLLAAVGAWALLSAVTSSSARVKYQRASAVAMVALLSLSFLATTTHSVGNVARLMAPDTRLGQENLLSENGIVRENTVFEGYTPFRPNGTRTIFDRFDVVGDRLVPDDETVEFVMLSSSMNGRFMNPSRYPEQRAFYENLRAEFTPVSRVSATIRNPGETVFEPVMVWRSMQQVVLVAQGGSVGPTLEIYRVPR